jgi:hypothetical protein
MTYEPQTITIDGKDYNPETFTDEEKRQFEMIKACDRKLTDLQQEAAIVQTARFSYVSALRDLLAKEAAN